MATIRIISNPYRKEIKFELLDQSTSEWIEINYQNNSGSKLIKEEIKTNFFPYKVREIVEILINEYASSEGKLELVFAGSPDEYRELVEVCGDFSDVEVQMDSMKLENARDILPKIIDIFTNIKEIADENIESPVVKTLVDCDVNKFVDASKDTVPICVMGNYSSGKSTFINALIGQEVLPSGDMPVTAKIYKITQSKEDGKASIALKYNDKPVTLEFNEDSIEIKKEEDSAFVSSIIECLEENKDQPFMYKVHCCLDAINNERNGVADLIEVVIPFGKGLLKESEKSFVIFDTPGSNAATNTDHFTILEEAMKDLSNGIPIYVAEYNSLDSCDNEYLYKRIKRISQVDSRFTMIVVNKADSANIKEDSFDDETKGLILKQAVPRNLYSGGIFFVSSVMGLGSKNGGDFRDDHADEFFEDNERKYSDETSKRYKSLYKYNIMPKQLKESIVSISEQASDKIYANSGLLAIEHEIVSFAEKYSAYDKCKQSDKYIDRIVDAAQEEIGEITEARELKANELVAEMEEDKAALIVEIEAEGAKNSELYLNSYDENMEGILSDKAFVYEYSDMKSVEQDFIKQKQEACNLSEHIENVKASGADIIGHFSEFMEKDAGEVIKGISQDLKKTFDNIKVFRETKLEADTAAAEELMKFVSDDYNVRLDEAIKAVGENSKVYWLNAVEVIKRGIAFVVANSPTLDDKKKDELAQLILKDEKDMFKNNYKFEKETFEVKIWGITVANKIDTRKLVDSYNKLYCDELKNAFRVLKREHSSDFETWLNALINKIRVNVVDYSPKLSEKANIICEETKAIDGLKKTQMALRDYSDRIDSLMDWKVIV